jgi:hypothetical protein
VLHYRVFCNQLAADMLVSCGRVALVDNLYGPAKAVAGQLLQPPIFISVASRSQLYQRNKTVYRTPVTSFATDKVRCTSACCTPWWPGRLAVDRMLTRL